MKVGAVAVQIFSRKTGNILAKQLLIEEFKSLFKSFNFGNKRI